jgi:hypothetical protein
MSILKTSKNENEVIFPKKHSLAKTQSIKRGKMSTKK